MKLLLWKFDMLIYRLFYWRWNKKLMNDDNLRSLFLRYLNSWDAISREPAMGVGKPPRFPVPKAEVKE